MNAKDFQTAYLFTREYPSTYNSQYLAFVDAQIQGIDAKDIIHKFPDIAREEERDLARQQAEWDKLTLRERAEIMKSRGM